MEITKTMSNKDLYRVQTEIKSQVNIQLWKYISLFDSKGKFDTDATLDSWVISQMMEILKELNYGGYVMNKKQRDILDDIGRKKKLSFNDCVSTWFNSEYMDIKHDFQFSDNTKKQICRGIKYRRG